MYANEKGELIDEELSKEDEEHLRIREFFLKNPIVGIKQTIDFIEFNKDSAKDIIVKLKEILFLDKYPEETLVKLYDNTRYELFIYYKTKLQ
jgi:hypothetical protein